MNTDLIYVADIKNNQDSDKHLNYLSQLHSFYFYILN